MLFKCSSVVVQRPPCGSVPLKARPPSGPLYTLCRAILGCDTKIWKMSSPPVRSLLACHRLLIELTSPDVTASNLCLCCHPNSPRWSPLKDTGDIPRREGVLVNTKQDLSGLLLQCVDANSRGIERWRAVRGLLTTDCSEFSQDETPGGLISSSLLLVRNQ